MRRLFCPCVFWLAATLNAICFAQPLGEPDRGQPGDEMIQQFLAREAVRLDAQFAEDFASKEVWEAKREQYQQEYLYMLGLWPLPEKTPLKATVTGTLEGDGYLVEKLHYQSKPGLYVTAKLVSTAQAASRERNFPRCSMSAGIPAAAATATRPRISRTASGSPGTGTSA